MSYRAGDQIGDYKIVSKIKAGGMATLFLAQRAGASGFQRHVALKVVHEHLASDPMFVEMFVDEAKLSSRINHPAVVHIEELRQFDGTHVLVMEYVAGCSLKQLMRELAKAKRRLHPQMAVYIAAKVLEGLHAAHELREPSGDYVGVVHRDVSPENVLLAFQGHVKLIDFGVAKARGRAQQTTGGSLKGKISYMSPEQAFGTDIDRTTDVYALAVVLWELLCMRRRFSGQSELALLDAVRGATPDPIRPHNSDVSEALEQCIMKAMSPNREDRYPTALAFRKAMFGAVPEAAVVDAQQLGELLSALMAEQVSEVLKTLGASIDDSTVVLPLSESADEVVGAMTVTGQAAPSFNEAMQSSRSRSPETNSVSVAEAVPPTVVAVDVSEVSVLEPRLQTPVVDSTDHTKLPWLLIGVAVACLVVAAGALFYAFSGGQTKPTAVPLEAKVVDAAVERPDASLPDQDIPDALVPDAKVPDAHVSTMRRGGRMIRGMRGMKGDSTTIMKRIADDFGF